MMDIFIVKGSQEGRGADHEEGNLIIMIVAKESL